MPQFRQRLLGTFCAQPTTLALSKEVFGQTLIRELEQAGFVNRGGKGSHRNFIHPNVIKPVVISGQLGDEAQHYQEKAVKVAVEESKK